MHLDLLVQPQKLLLRKPLQLRQRQPPHAQRAAGRQVDLSLWVDGKPVCLLREELAPVAQLDLVARAQRVVRRDSGVRRRLERSSVLREQVAAKGLELAVILLFLFELGAAERSLLDRACHDGALFLLGLLDALRQGRLFARLVGVLGLLLRFRLDGCLRLFLGSGRSQDGYPSAQQQGGRQAQDPVRATAETSWREHGDCGDSRPKGRSGTLRSSHVGSMRKIRHAVTCSFCGGRIEAVGGRTPGVPSRTDGQHTGARRATLEAGWGGGGREEEWCRDPGLNWGHLDFQSSALPTELSRHLLSAGGRNGGPDRI